ncbi:MAG: hypothetical protein ACQEW2_16625 [Bacillota bacterium]
MMMISFSSLIIAVMTFNHKK